MINISKHAVAAVRVNPMPAIVVAASNKENGIETGNPKLVATQDNPILMRTKVRLTLKGLFSAPIFPNTWKAMNDTVNVAGAKIPATNGAVAEEVTHAVPAPRIDGTIL